MKKLITRLKAEIQAEIYSEYPKKLTTIPLVIVHFPIVTSTEYGITKIKSQSKLTQIIEVFEDSKAKTVDVSEQIEEILNKIAGIRFSHRKELEMGNNNVGYRAVNYYDIDGLGIKL